MVLVGGCEKICKYLIKKCILHISPKYLNKLSALYATVFNVIGDFADEVSLMLDAKISPNLYYTNLKGGTHMHVIFQLILHSTSRLDIFKRVLEKSDLREKKCTLLGMEFNLSDSLFITVIYSRKYKEKMDIFLQFNPSLRNLIILKKTIVMVKEPVVMEIELLPSVNKMKNISYASSLINKEVQSIKSIIEEETNIIPDLSILIAFLSI